MDRDRTIVANFTGGGGGCPPNCPETRYLTTIETPSDGGRVDVPPPNSEGGYANGTSITITAIANTPYTFAGWSSTDPNFSCPGTGSCMLTMDRDRTVTARFACPGGSCDPLTWNLSVSVTPLEGGFTYTDPDGTQFPRSGTPVQVAVYAYPNDDRYTFSGWEGDVGSNCPGATTPCTLVTMNADKSVVANFNLTCNGPCPLIHYLTVTEDPFEGGIVDISPLPDPATGGYRNTDQVTLAPNPNPGYEFVRWTGDVGTSCPGT